MKWLHTYYWLPYTVGAYSESLNGRLYITCVFHLKINHNQVGKCVTSSMIKFKDAIADLRNHESTIYNNNSLEENSHFIAMIENKKHASAISYNASKQ